METKMMAHEQERFLLRYTQDQHMIKAAPTLEEAKPTFPSDYKIHIWDRLTQKVVWQNHESVRYGRAGLDD